MSVSEKSAEYGDTSSGPLSLWNGTINQTEIGENETEQFYALIKQPLHLIIIFTAAYMLVFIFALIGNIMVVAVVYRNKRMHTATNYFIANLAVADILVAIFVLPMTLLANLFTGWPWGAFLCKATPYLQGCSVFISVNTLQAIAIDRYLAICYMMQFKLTGRVCRNIIFLIWLVALTIFIPWAIFYRMERYPSTLQVIYVCYQTWDTNVERYFFLCVIFLIFYTIPLIVITICYGLIGLRVWNRDAPGVCTNSGVVHDSKVRAIKMLLVVYILFAFSWLPLYSLHLWRYFGVDASGGNQLIVHNVLLPIAQWLGSSNSGMNPIIYCFFSKKFRKGFKSIARCCQKDNASPGARMSSTTKYMTVDYTNGQFKVSFKRDANDDDSSSNKQYV